MLKHWVRGAMRKQGTWLYAGTVPKGVQIEERIFRPGTGDHQDSPEFAEDQPGEWFEVRYETEPDKYGAGGGFFQTLEEAMQSVKKHTQGTVKWK